MAAVGLLLFGWLMNTPAGLLGKADAIGYAVCHRIDVRSFHLGERAISLCARCTGMYLAAVVGLGYQGLVSRKRSGTPKRWMLIVLGAFVAAFAVDGVNSALALFLGRGPLYEPNNTLRLITGTGMGLAIAALLYPAFQDAAWVERDARRALETRGEFWGLVGAGAIAGALVLTENPLILYPLALMSAAGVLIVLTMAYSLLAMMLMKSENQARRWRELSLALAGGFGLGLAQIALVDLARYWLTGTWEGLHLILG